MTPHTVSRFKYICESKADNHLCNKTLDNQFLTANAYKLFLIPQLFTMLVVMVGAPYLIY